LYLDYRSSVLKSFQVRMSYKYALVLTPYTFIIARMLIK